MGKINIKSGKIGRVRLLKMVEEMDRIKIGVLSVFVEIEKYGETAYEYTCDWEWV